MALNEIPKLVEVTFTLDTSAYSAGDLLADSKQVVGALRDKNRAMILQSLTLIDEDDQGVAMDVYFLSSNVSFGTFNQAPGITDTDARSVLGFIPVAAADWKDLGGVRVACLRGLGLVLKPVTDSIDVYVAVVNGAGTPTFTVNGLKARLGIVSF